MSRLMYSGFLGKVLLGSVFVSTIFGVASASAYTITYNANGALFDNGQETNEVVYDDNHNVTSGEEKNPYMNSPVTYELFWSTDTVGKKRVDPSNISSDTILYAQYKNVVWPFDYTGGEQTFTIPYNKYIRYELWGAEGGKTSDTLIGGYGGYSRGFASLTIDTIIYINNGQAGAPGTSYTYNGGGIPAPSGPISSSGGGATHIAFSSGVLSSLKDNKDDVFMVAGGAGGSTANNSGLKVGGSGGGFKGANGLGWFYGTGGTQTQAGANRAFTSYGNRNADFGQGGNAEGSPSTNWVGAGGGSGYYGGSGGGYGSSDTLGGSGAGGSGYIANPNIIDGIMYGYNVPTDDNQTTLTYTTDNYSDTATTNYAKAGNGYTTVSVVMPAITYQWDSNEESMNIVYREKAAINDIDPSRTTKTGYTLTWQLNGIDYDFDTPVTEDIVLVAKYTPIVYNLSYNLNSGTVITPNPATYTIESAPITLANPTKDYYSFTGWSGTGLTGGENTEVTIPTGSYGDREYTANYTPIDYTITYSLDGGTNNANNPATYNYETSDITLADPTKEGHDFKGWIENAGDTPGSITIPTNSHGDRAFTAVFDINEYTATFDSNLGTAANPSTITKNFGEVLGELPTTSRTGYNFDGWFTGQNDGDEIFASTTMPATNPTYYAHWTPIQYTFKFNANGAEGAMSDLVYDYDEEKPLTTMSFTKLGYTFTGWNTDADGNGDDYSDGQNIKNLTTVDGTIYTLYAQWSRDNYTIDYNLADGETSETLVTSYNVESDDIALPTPTRKGYKFLGWSGTDITDKEVNITIPTGSTGNRSYTANWEIVNYTITYVMDGHTNDVSNPTSYTINSADIIIRDATPKEYYYYFVGWTTDKDTEADLTKDFTIPTGSTGNITLYAIFQQNPYTVSFDSDGAGSFSDIVRYGADPVGTLPTPEKEGYTFLGWFANGRKIDENYVSRSDITVVARWEEIIVVPNTGANMLGFGDASQNNLIVFTICCLLGLLVALKKRSEVTK